MTTNRVLVISAHLDDEVLGVGATMVKHAAAGDEVTVLNVCDRSERHRFDADMVAKLRAEAKEMCRIIGVKRLMHGKLADEYLDMSLAEVIRPIEEAIETVRPNVIYTHHHGDVNQDHRAIFQATLVATRSFSYSFIEKVYAFEILSSTEQAPMAVPGYAFAPTHFVPMTKAALQKKIRGMYCYPSEVDRYPFPRSKEGITTLAMYRGMQCFSRYAEAFETIKTVERA